MRIEWDELGTAPADRADGAEVEIDGWMASPEPSDRMSYFLLAHEPPCCCLPRNPLTAIEIFAAYPVPFGAGAIRLRGRWSVLANDPAGWRYQLREARLVPSAPMRLISRRDVLTAGSSLGIVVAMGGPSGGPTPATETEQPDTKTAAAGRQAIADTSTVDVHSHAGAVLHVNQNNGGAPFIALADPMREGGMATICLAISADAPVHKVMSDHRIHPFRDPAPGELYAFCQRAFERVHALVRDQKLKIILDVASLHAARSNAPGVIVTSEGADFLEGNVDRVDEAYRKWSLRHLQLVHYRVNELGDIQTEPTRHGGLTDFGADVIRRCNKLGLVVDVAHGTLDLVKRAASVTTKPLLLSHTALEDDPPRFSRHITPEHARIVAGTSGVVGIWSSAGSSPTKHQYALNMAKLVEVVGIDHVALGSDMMGLIGPSILDSYSELPELAGELVDVGFQPDEVRKILGGNYRRIFEASLA